MESEGRVGKSGGEGEERGRQGGAVCEINDHVGRGGEQSQAQRQGRRGGGDTGELG